MKHEAGVVFLQGPRVVMRPLARSDISRLLRWKNDPDIQKYLSAYLPVTQEMEEEWFDSRQKDKDTRIVLGIEVEGKLIGSMGINNISWKDRCASTGAVIGEKDYWGKGYGTEAKMLILNYAFNTLNLRKICSAVFDFNGRSQAYLKKTGYKVEGVRREHDYIDGEYVDQVLMAVFKEDFMPLWEEFRTTF